MNGNTCFFVCALAFSVLMAHAVNFMQTDSLDKIQERLTSLEQKK